MEETENIIRPLSLSDEWNLHSIDTISYLQDKLGPYESWVVKASVFGDNREAFTFFFPVIAGLRIELGARVMWAAILVEWSNLIMKWLFKGDRPYWWVGETDLYDEISRPVLRQFPNTCESGPGTPSGHLMMNTALFYIVVKGISSVFIWASKTLSKGLKIGLTLTLYTVYALWIGVIFISRLYIQAHFIHQCVFGIVMGLVVGQIAWSSQWLVKLTTVWAVVVSNLLFAISILTYVYLMSKGLDPLWTIPLALKHCVRTEYVKIDTQPFYIMVRFTGAALGLGLGIASQQYKIIQKSPSHFLRTVLGMKGGMLIGRMAAFIQEQIPTDDLAMFLTMSLGVNLVMPFIIISVLPHFLFTVYPPQGFQG